MARILEYLFSEYDEHNDVIAAPFAQWREVEPEEAKAVYERGGNLLINPFGTFTSNRLPNTTHYVDGWVYIGEVEEVQYVLDSMVYGHSGVFKRGRYAKPSGRAYMHWNEQDPDFDQLASWYIPVGE